MPPEYPRRQARTSSGACGAGCIHGKVFNPDPLRSCIAGEGNELRVLSAHLDDGARIRMIVTGKSGLSEYLIDEQSSNRPGNLLAAAAGVARCTDVAFGKFRREGPKLVLEGLERVALDSGVCLGEERLVPIEECGLDGHRTDIDTEEEVFLHEPFLYCSGFASYDNKGYGRSAHPVRRDRDRRSITTIDIFSTLSGVRA